MSVDSYLELFTSLFGWAFYGILWDVLVSTGIVYLPFLGILIDNWREPAQGGEVRSCTADCRCGVWRSSSSSRCWWSCSPGSPRRSLPSTPQP
jgi:hypothetical protein